MYFMGYLRYCTYCFWILFLVGTWSAFAIVGTSSDGKIMTQAYKTHQDSRKKYHQDAIIDFSSKLNTAIKNHQDLKHLSQSCGGCDVILPEFDEYLKTNFPVLDDDAKEKLRKKLQGQSYGNKIAGNYLNESISWSLSAKDIKALDSLLVDALIPVVQQTNDQVQTYNDIKTPGSYTDGDLTNSPYDLMDDVQKIMKLLFQDPAQYDGVVNTMDSDAWGLITGRFQTGEWAQGETYEIDLASDVASALWQGENGDSGTSNGGGDDCEDGFCITVDVILNDSYSWGDRGTSFVDKNFEEIFGSGLDWLVKKWDKRNLACKAPPPVNFFQSNNDLNLSFKNIFRGLGIFVFQKTPKYAKSDGWSEEKKTIKEKEKEMDDAIEESFKNYNIDPDNLLLYTEEQMIEEYTPIARNAINSADNQKRAAERKDTKINQKMSHSNKMNEAGNVDAAPKNMFRFIESSIKSFGTMVKDLFDILNVWGKKPDCKN